MKSWDTSDNIFVVEFIGYVYQSLFFTFVRVGQSGISAAVGFVGERIWNSPKFLKRSLEF